MTPRITFSVFAITGFLAGLLIAGIVAPSLKKTESNESEPSKAFSLRSQRGDRVGSVDLGNAFEIDDPRISFRVLKRIAEVRALDDPIAAVKAAMDIPGHDNREAYFAAALQTWGESDGQAAAEWCSENFEGELMTDAMYWVADGWAESDPEAAGIWFNENTDADIREDALWEVLEAWGRKDPESAFRWSDDLDSDVKSMVMDGLAEGWAAVDPEGAARAGLTMQGKNYEYDFLAGVATQWSGLEPVRAMQWAGEVLHEGVREGVFLEVGEIWAHDKPVDAASRAESIVEADNRRSMLSGVAIGWSEHDPDAAAEWVLGVETDEAHQNDMLGDIIFNWSNIDPGGTVEWVEAQDDGPRKDKFLSVFSDVLMGIDSEVAVAWANQMSDPVERDTKLRLLIDRWIKTKGAIAYKTLGGMEGLPADIRSEFIDR